MARMRFSVAGAHQRLAAARFSMAGPRQRLAGLVLSVSSQPDAFALAPAVVWLRRCGFDAATRVEGVRVWLARALEGFGDADAGEAFAPRDGAAPFL
jgi:hypothetical protein